MLTIKWLDRNGCERIVEGEDVSARIEAGLVQGVSFRASNGFPHIVQHETTVEVRNSGGNVVAEYAVLEDREAKLLAFSKALSGTDDPSNEGLGPEPPSASINDLPWRRWLGGNNPAPGKVVAYKKRRGSDGVEMSDKLLWSHHSLPTDIIGYKVVS